MRNSLFCLSRVQKHARFFCVLEVRFSRASTRSLLCARIKLVVNLSSLSLNFVKFVNEAYSRSSCNRGGLRGREGREDCGYVCVWGSFLNYQLKN